MPTTIRQLELSEAPVLNNVADGVSDNPADPRWTREFFADPRHHIVVALDGETVVGMATGVHYVHPDKAPELFGNEVGVAPAHRQRGIGKEMLRTLLAHGRTLGCTGAWLGTEPDNVAARRLYQSLEGKEGKEGEEDKAPFVVYWFEAGSKP